MNIRSTALCAACALVLGGCDAHPDLPKVTAQTFSPIGTAAAQQADLVVPPEAIAGAMSPVDEAFAIFATSSALTQIEGARIVVKEGRRSDVRDFAQRLVRDHTEGRTALRRIVVPRGVKLPAAPTGRHADLLTKLTGVPPDALDDAFLSRFGLDAHKEAIALFERHAADGESPQLKAYAREMLPVLREHLAIARKLVHATGATR